jgi:hypothetical protein
MKNLATNQKEMLWEETEDVYKLEEKKRRTSEQHIVAYLLVRPASISVARRSVAIT